MILKLTFKNCRPSPSSRNYIDEYVNKISRQLKHIPGDEIVLRLTIRKNTDRYFPPKVEHHKHKRYADLKPVLAYFEGSITFRLNKNRFYAYFKGQSIDECTKIGFDRLLKEINRFRNQHFSSESDYSDKASIRGINQ